MDIASEMDRLVRNASFVRSAARRGVERALSQTLQGPTAVSVGVALRELGGRSGHERVPAAALAQQLSEQRWAVLDGALPAELVRAASSEAERLLALGALGRQPGIHELRQDHFSMLQPSPLWPSLSNLLRRLHGASRRLSDLGALGGGLQADPAGGMLACYRHGGRYALHVDRGTRPSAACHGAACASEHQQRNAAQRRATAVLYLGAQAGAWEPDLGGELRLWPSSATQSQAALLSAGSAVDVEPRAGRLLLFDAGLAHEVRPWGGEATARCALTLWIHRSAGDPADA